MSTTIESLKKLSTQQQQARQSVPSVVPTAISISPVVMPGVRLPRLERVEDMAVYLARALDMPESSVASVCLSSEDAKTWCEYLYRLLSGESVSMPSTPFPPGMEALIDAVARKVGSLELRRLVEKRSREFAEAIARYIESLRRTAKEAVRLLAEKRVDEAVKKAEDVVKAIIQLEKSLPRQSVSETAVTAMLEEISRRAVVPEQKIVEIKKDLMKQMLTATPNTATQTAQSIVTTLQKTFIPETKTVSAQQITAKIIETAGKTPVTTTPNGMPVAAKLRELTAK